MIVLLAVNGGCQEFSLKINEKKKVKRKLGEKRKREGKFYLNLFVCGFN